MNAIMNTAVRTASLVRSGKFVAAVQEWRARKVDQIVAGVFAWALSKQAVQEVVVDAFTKRQTPMCQALDHAITSALQDVMHELDADDVKGLDRYIEDGIEGFMRDGIDADVIKGFDRAVEHAVEEALSGDSDFRKEIIDSALEEMAARMRG